METGMGLALAHVCLDYADLSGNIIHNLDHWRIAMPYKRIGNTIYHKKAGKWTVKQRCGNADKAKAALRLLQDLEKKER